METVIHGETPPGIRDHHGVFGGEKPEPTPQSRLLALRTKIADLKRSHAEAQDSFRSAVEDDGVKFDFQALKSKVHRLASELEAAEQEAAQWQDVVHQIEKADRARQFEEKLLQARVARAKFAEHFKQACLQLGVWYGLGSEIRELTNQLADHLPNGHVYRPPDLTAALCEVDENPDPLSALKDAGYSEITTTTSWRRHVAVVPLAAKEK